MWLFLIRRLRLLFVFRMFDLTLHQEKKVSSLLVQKNITQSLHGGIERYKRNLLTKCYFLSLITFQNMNA